MKTHPHANLFPDMTETEYKELKADIKANGCHVPVVVYDGMILDGRHRYRACKELGDSYPISHWTPKDGQSVVEYVVSLNLHRRQLSTDQKAILGNQIRKELKREKTLTSGVSRDTPAGKSSDRAAKMVSTSASSINRAAKLERDDPEAYAKVKSGEISLSQARKGPPPAKKKSKGPPPARSKLDKAKAAESPLKEIAKLCRSSRKLVREIDGQPIGAHFNAPQALADIKNLETAAKWALPHALCPLCGGKRGCKNCNGSGWVPRSIFERWESHPGQRDESLGLVEQAIQDQWQLRQLVNLTTQLTKGFNEIKKTEAATFIDDQFVTSDIRMLGHRLRCGIAYIICPWCEGKKCKACHRQGWVTKKQFDHFGNEFEREEHLKQYPPPKTASKDE